MENKEEIKKLLIELKDDISKIVELQKYNIQEIFTLFDITDIKESNKNYTKQINDILDINVNGYPVIIYYEDGQISSYKRIKNSKDFESVIKKTNVEKNSR